MDDDRDEMGSFVEWLGEQRDGATVAELSAAMRELVEAVVLCGKQGSLTFRVTVRPEGGAVVVSDEVTVKAPKPDRGVSVFFVDDEFGLSRRDPRALPLPFDPPPEVTVDPLTGGVVG